MQKIAAALATVSALATPASHAAAERAIEQQVTVQAPVAAVWQAWTTTAGVKTFFAPDAQIELRVGGPFNIYFNPYAAPGMKGADDMQIIGFQDQRMLTFTWNAPPHLPQARQQRTVVILRLAAASPGTTLVTLTHVGWGDGGEWDQAYAYFSKAWPTVLANLQKRFTDAPLDWTAHLAAMKKFMESPPAK